MANALRIRCGDGRGIQSRGSVLVNRTADGVGLDDIWAEIQEALQVYNSERSAIASLVSFRTTRPGDAIPQNVLAESFEEATEYGQPRGIADPSYLKLGFTLKDYDLALRSTWKYLRDATSEQITSQVTRVLEADNRLTNTLVLNRLFSPTPQTNDQLLTCYGLWNGDGQKPPSHLGLNFDGAHTHYLSTASTVLDAQDVEAAIKHVKHHGYGSTQAARFLLLVHPDDVEVAGMTTWRAGVQYRAGAPLPSYDFIVTSAAPAFLTNQRVQGEAPPVEYGGIPVLGSYAGALVIQSYFVPKGWAAVVASGGANSDDNPIGVRDHYSPDYQGLRHIAGNAPYPLQDSFFARTIGVGVRHRGAAVAIQISENTSYTAPVIQVP